jgi:hypothetical protein
LFACQFHTLICFPRQICKFVSEFIEKLQASFAASGLSCPALDVIHSSAKFSQAGCTVSENLSVQDSDLQWIQSFASAMSSSTVTSGHNLSPAPFSPVTTVIQLANMRRFSLNISHAYSILSSALQLCDSGSPAFSNPTHTGTLHHNLGDLLRERQQFDECKLHLDRADSCFPANSLNEFEAFLAASALDRERLLQESDAKRCVFAEIAAVIATRARLLESLLLLEEAEKLFTKSLNALRVSIRIVMCVCNDCVRYLLTFI